MIVFFAEARSESAGLLRERCEDRENREEAEADAERLADRWRLDTKIAIVERERGVGQPPKGERALSVATTVRFRAAELEAARSAAASAGVHMTSWIRARVLESLGIDE